MTELFERRLISFDETPIFYRRVSPPAPKASLFLLHGMGEHGGRYVRTAFFMAEAGIECWIADLRGFGKSGGPRAHVRRFEDLKNDLSALTELSGREAPHLPQFYLGHSFGGLLAASAAADGGNRRLKGLILSSPLFGVSMPVPAWKEALARAASVLTPAYSQDAGIPTTFLTHDPEALKEHARDPLIDLRMSARLYTEMTQALLKRGVYASKIHLPTLILQAGDDRIVSKEKVLTFYERLVAGDKQLEIYPGWYHEILQEIKREVVYEQIRSWIIKRI